MRRGKENVVQKKTFLRGRGRLCFGIKIYYAASRPPEVVRRRRLRLRRRQKRFIAGAILRSFKNLSSPYLRFSALRPRAQEVVVEVREDIAGNEAIDETPEASDNGAGDRWAVALVDGREKGDHGVPVRSTREE